MSGLLGVRLLLLWGCACLWLSGEARGALFISKNHEAPQETRGAARSVQKRSTNQATVEVYSVTVECTVTSRFAHTVMTSKALNAANVSQEIFFEVELPKTAFITNFSMEIEGQVYVGEVKEKEKAKKQYEKAVSSGQTAGLVKASGRKMEKFSVSVNIAAKSNVTFILTYEELLQRKLGQYEILTRVKPKTPVQEFQIVANIYEPQGIAFADAHATFLTNDLLPLVEKTVHISFSPTLEQQRKCSGCDASVIDGDFIINYDVIRGKGLGDIQIVNGYFVHFFAPPDLERVPKNLVFVIDRSGSMSGTKMRQTREALLEILKDIYEEDYFALVEFDDQIAAWRDTLSKATKQNVSEAMDYVRQLSSRGGTNINDAVLRGVEMLITDKRENRVPERNVDMIILLTDGSPNSGESRPSKIQENVRNAIGGNMTLFCLGFGNDVEYSFLDVLSKENKGLARRIFEASDATLQLQGFYNEVASPLLSEVDLRYPDNAVDFLTTNHFSQLFNGSEIVVAGRLMDNDLDNFLVEVYGQGSEDDFSVQGQATALNWDVIYPDEEYIFGDFTERLWAYLTIQQLLEKSKIGSAEEKDNATAKALDMSLQYSFVTPLTSMVVTKPETEDGTESPLIADKLTEVDGDPHFMIELPDRDDALCFNINDEPGTIFTLVKDPESGILVNGQIIGDKKIPPDGKINTYFWRFGIIHRTLGVRLEVSTQDISVFQDGQRIKLLWSDTASLKGPNMDLQVTKDRSLMVTLKDSVKFVILLHKVWEKHPYHRDYLGFYTLDSHLLSSSVHGLLGQFYHGIEYEVTDLRPGEVPEKPDATMFVKGQELNVTRGWQRDFRKDVKNGENVPCWFIHNNGTGLIDGVERDYVVSGLFKTFFIVSNIVMLLGQKTMPEERLLRFPGMTVVWTALLLGACLCIWLPAQARGAVVISRRDALSQEPETALGARSIKKRSTGSANMVEVHSVRIHCTVTSRFAHTVMTSKALNAANVSQEIFFEVELPKSLHHQLQHIVADIYEPQGIDFVDTTATFLTNDLLPLVEKTFTDKEAHISFSPTLEQQRKCPGCEDTIIDGDFIIKYDVKREEGPGEIQIVNGYFVHFFAPPDMQQVPKNLVFVIDRSGSMAGTKMKQTREAMVAILQDLHEQDHFALILFDSSVITWKKNLTKATKENVAKAITYIRKIQEEGATNINSAVLKAVSMLERERKDKKLPERSMDMIILLTDGMPNTGVSSLPQIQKNVRSAIGGNMSLFCLGFGNDVDYSFLDVMSKENKGLARRIYEASDAALQLQGFYSEVASPLLLEVDMRYADNTVDSVTKKHFSQLFNGSEIVVAGRLNDGDLDNFVVEVFGQGLERDFQVQRKAQVVNWKVTYPEQEYIFGNFTERLWAYLTIQQLLEDSNIGSQQDKESMASKALDMSLRYSFVTPLTSMVVTKPETQDGPDSPLIADKLTEVDGDPHFMIELPDRGDALCFNINDKQGTIFSLVRDPRSGFVVNGQIIGKKKLAPEGKVNTYFGRFGISHEKLGVRLDVSTQDISVLYNGREEVKLLWSDTASIKETNHHLSASVHGLLGQFYRGVQYEVTDFRPGDVQEELDATMYVKGQTVNVTRHWQKDFSRNLKDGENVPCWFVDNDGSGLIDGRASDYIVSGLFETI
ncbi:hypothetical protein INR49_012643 [Caranx melampygus]|nr:hypothetical protein INR49_012643 [Caranx melampygus]